jgi:hypothetical protein
VLTADKNGLSDLYRKAKRDPDYFGYFHPTTVSGYPAIFNGRKGQRSQGSCGIAFGVR